MPFSCYNTGNCGTCVNNFSSTLHLGVNYTRLYPNGINEPTEEKGYQRGGWMKEEMDLLVVATQPFLRSVQCEISLNTRLASNNGVLKNKILLLYCSNKVLE